MKSLLYFSIYIQVNNLGVLLSLTKLDPSFMLKINFGF